MTSIATLTYSSQNSVQIDWGDGSVQIHPAAPPPSTNTVHHTFPSAGPWNVVLTDTVNGLSTSRSVLCTTCDISGAILHEGDATAGQWTLGPITNGTGGNVTVDWGDGSSPQTVASGGTATHQFLPASGPGPFAVSVSDPAVPGCVVGVTGGNDPTNPGADTIIVPPNVTVTCAAPSANNEDVLTVTITGPDNATYTINWGDGNSSTGLLAGSHNHTFALPAGVERNITVAQNETSWTSATITITCPVPPLVTSLSCDFVANCVKEASSPVHQGSPPTNVTFGPASQAFNVDWGDGSTVANVSAGATLAHTFATPAAGTTSRYMIVFTSPTNPACFDQAQVTIVG